MKTKFMRLMEDDLIKARMGLNKKNGTKAIEKIHQRIGGIREKYKRIAGLYKIEVVPDKATKKAVDIKWQVMKQKESKKLGRLSSGVVH